MGVQLYRSGVIIQPWLAELPIRMQTAMIMSMRNLDNYQLDKAKYIVRWLRGLALKPSGPKQAAKFMYFKLPPRVFQVKGKKSDVYKELEHSSVHFFTHLAEALEVTAYAYPKKEISDWAAILYDDFCRMSASVPEPKDEFWKRMSKQKSIEARSYQSGEIYVGHELAAQQIVMLGLNQDDPDDDLFDDDDEIEYWT